jgi:uracil-DNA glycosylase
VHWARQGVLLLNTVLTVEQAQPASHAGKGWEVLTHMIVRSLVEGTEPRVFMAWGAQAQALLADVPARHLLLQANHPSPLSASRPPRPFVGCGHFGQANLWLLSQGREPIAW